jgi:anionic cell wall polymer biosynthesis LytR-Cps2A-Psr (LCP) family protein
MDIPFHMKYDDIYDKPPLHIDIPAGPQILDGENSVDFLRYRKGYLEGDIGRVNAQQTFMKSAFKQALSSDFSNLAATVLENVTSDIPIKDMIFLVSKAIGISSEDITTHVMPGWADPEPPYYVYPDSKGIEELVREIYMPTPETVTVTGSAVEARGGSANGS